MDKNFYNEASAARLGWDPSWFGERFFDDRLTRAVKKYQRSKGLSADGMCGPATFRRLWTDRQENIDDHMPEAQQYSNYVVAKKTVAKVEKDIDSNMFRVLASYIFGNNKNHHFDLLVNIEEKKTKKSVESNQAASNLMYELRFFYKLVSKKENCVTFEKKILSSFSIIPKSAGYDYGTDFSIDKKYELAINDNFNQFISSLRTVDINSCQLHFITVQF